MTTSGRKTWDPLPSRINPIRNIPALLFLALSGLAPYATAQVWGTPPLLPATQQAAMAYDSVHQVTVLFGGYNDNVETATNTTWLWNGTTWTQAFPANSPPARFGHAMAFDSAHGQVVLFGGANTSVGAISDTWTWNGTNWTQQAPHQIPPARSGHAMAYDASLGLTVMFGGEALTDTWSWDGTDWTEASPQTTPPWRNNPSMVYDAARSQIVMFGGDNQVSSLADTWVWNGTNWTAKLPATSPTPLTEAAMAYDSVNQESVLFGGFDFGNDIVYAQTWIWNGTTWAQKSPATSPAARTFHSMAYDSARQVTVVFGGNLFSDTWTWNETNWTEAAPPTSPPLRGSHGMAYDGARQQVVVFGGAAIGSYFLFRIAPYNDTWVWNGSNWTQKLPLTSPSARSCVTMAYDAANQQTVLFGGLDQNSNFLSDTWAWDGTNWTEMASSGPPARACYQMAYDGLHQQIVLFGGQNAGGALSDTWLWNGSNWAQASPAMSPNPLYSSAMTYDSVHQVVLLFDGLTGDTWTWNGSAWNRLFPAGSSPDTRTDFAMAFDSAHRYSMVLGGELFYGESSPTATDTWLYNGTVWQVSAPWLPGLYNPYYTGAFPGLAFDAAHGKTVLFGGIALGSNITHVFPANTIASTGGTPQSTTPGQSFGTPLQVTVSNLLGQPIASDTVNFSVNSSFATLSAPTATTNASGQAQITATSTATVGSYTVTAVIADGGSATFALTNTGAGPAASITATGGTGQSTAAGTAFTSPLTAVVKDAAGVALSGITVTFGVPASGPIATFSPSASIQTNAQGVASVNVTAGTIAGGYDVTASVSAVSAEAYYTLENAPGSAASVTATGGGSQTAAIEMLFPAPLTAVVKDSHGNVIPGVTVTFSAPAAGAGATFLPSASVTANSSGIAMVNATANGNAGSYNVSAAVSGVGTAATFALTNASAAPATITVTGGGSQSSPIGSAFTTPLTAVVKNAAGDLITGVSVTFAGPGSGAGATFSPSATVTTNSTGTATVTATANGTAGGPYNVTASVPGVGTPATFPLTNTAPSYTLSLSTMLEPSQPGSDSVTLLVNGTPNSWTAASGASWLHLGNSSTSGSNSALLTFTFDANAGATRSGTININGSAALTVTQAGAAYTKAGVITLVAKGSAPKNVAVDHSGNVYVANGNVQEWSASTQTVSTLIAAGTQGLSSASALTVDSSENIYILDGTAIRKWTAASQQLSTLISSGLTDPNSLAVDVNGNLYIGDYPDIRKWTASTQQLSVMFTGMLGGPVLAVDPSGDLFFTSPNGTEEWNASTQEVMVVDDSYSINPTGYACDSAGNLYIADGFGAVEKWTAATQTLSLLVGSGLTAPAAIAADSSGNLYIADGVLIKKWLASNQTLSTFIDDTFLAGTSFGLEGVALDNTGNVYLADQGNSAVEKFNPSTHQFTTLFSVGAPAGVAADSAGNIYVASAVTSGAGPIEKWTASTQQVSTVFSVGQPEGLALDPAGDIFVADFGDSAIDEYRPQTGQLNTLASRESGILYISGTSLDLLGNYYVTDYWYNDIVEGNASTAPSPIVSSDLLSPFDAQADRSGNLYIVDQARILKYSAATRQTTVLASSGFAGPNGIAPDSSGDLFINDGTRLLEMVNGYVAAQPEFEPATAGTGSLPAVIPTTAPLYTTSSDQTWLAITGTANGVVSFSFTANTTGTERVAHITVLGVPVTVTQVPTATTAVSIAATSGSGQSANVGTAFATTLTATVTDLAGAGLSGVSVTFAAPATGAGATFSPSATVLTNASGIATVTATANAATGGYTVTATAAGVATPASFTLTNTVAASAYSLATPSVAESPAAGSDSVLIVANGTPASWSATSQAAWLTISAGSASGSGSATVKFTFTANTGATRTGTIMFNPGSLTLTVMQVGATYIPAGLIPLITTGLLNAEGTGEAGGVAVDAQDNVYLTASGAINLQVVYEVNPAAPQLNQLISNLDQPDGVAVDSLGDVFIADSGSNSVKKWTAATQQVSVLVSGNLSHPSDVKVDTAGNVYIADNYDNAVKKWTAATQQLSTLASGLSNPLAVAVDGAGNVFFSDNGNNEIKEWTAATQQTTIAVPGLSGPIGVAVDGGGNLYFSNSGTDTVDEWLASSQQTVVLVPSSQLPALFGAEGVALDSSGNLFVSDQTALYELPHAWIGPATVSEPNTAGSGTLLPVLPASVPVGTPVSDQSWLTITGTAGGVVSFSFTLNPDASTRVAHITMLGATITVTQAAGQGIPASISVSGGSAQSAAVSTAFASPLTAAVKDSDGNLLSGVSVTFAIPASGASAALSPGTTVNTNAQGVAAVTAIANGTLGAYTVTASVAGVSTPATFYLTNLAVSSYTIAASSLLEPAAGGADSISIRANGAPGPWIAESNANWLHLQPGSFTGPGSAAVGFTFDPNSGGNRSGTITFNPGALTLTVTQAGAAYVPAAPISPVTAGYGSLMDGVTTDSAGNVYFSSVFGVQEFNVVTQQTTTLLTFPNSAGTVTSGGVAVDSAGNVYGSSGTSVGKWTASTQTVSTIISAGLYNATGLTADAAGNLYIVDDGMGSQDVIGSGIGSIKFWNVSTQQLSTLVTGLAYPYPVKPVLDIVGNVYYTDYNNGIVWEWVAATQQAVTLITGLTQPLALALDTGGNLYIAYYSEGLYLLSRWSPLTQQLTPVKDADVAVNDLAFDKFGSLFIADSDSNEVHELPRAFVGPQAIAEPATAGTDSLLPVLPSTIPIYTPTSDANWLTVTGTKNDVVTFSFSANSTGVAGVGHVTVLGVPIAIEQTGATDPAAAVSVAGGSSQTAAVSTSFSTPLTARVTDGGGYPIGGITVTFAGPASGASVTFTPSGTAVTNDQGIATVTANANATAGGPYTVTAKVTGVTAPANFKLTNTSSSSYSAGPASLLEPNTSGVDSLLLRSSGSPAAWSAASSAAWLHLDNGNVTGTGSARILFYFDANNGATRTGTLTLNPGALTVTVTQVGANYIPGGLIALDANQTTVVAMAVDASDNVYLNTGTVVKRSVTTGQYTTLSSGLTSGGAVAVDQSGNVYYSDEQASIVYKWSSTSQSQSPLITSGLSAPNALAVDTAGNLYIADSGGIKEWSGSQLTTLTAATAQGIAVDSAGNVYLAEANNSAIQEWNVSTLQLVTVVSSGLSFPAGVAVDGAGNLYIADSNDDAIKQWNPLTQQLTTLAYQQYAYFTSFAIDGADNVFAGSGYGLQELVHGFIGPAAISERAAAGSDSLLVAVPSTAPLGGPSSDQTWLTIGSTTGGVVAFSFAANSGAASQVAHITAMGATITVTQAGTASNPGSIATTGGSGQGAAIGTAFAATLTAVVKDGNGNPLSGAAVTFAGPGSGAGVTFTPAATVATNNQGIATVTAMANATAGGPYSVTAAVAGVAAPATFTLTNFGAPASVTVVTGSGQRTLAGTPFATPLEALVKDSGGNALSGVTVTFSGPGSNASATFSPSATVLTDSAGVAIVTATGNATQGSYSAMAAVGALNAAFSLTNDAPSIVTATGGTPQSAPLNGPFSTALQVTVKDSGGNPMNGATVTFSSPATGASAALSSASAVTNASGVASVTATANGSAGAYNVTASVSGVATPATFALTNSSFSPCDPTHNGTPDVADIQRLVNEALGTASPVDDLNGDGKINVSDVQIVSNAVLSLGCSGS